jgi:hypothetical protein
MSIAGSKIGLSLKDVDQKTGADLSYVQLRFDSVNQLMSDPTYTCSRTKKELPRRDGHSRLRQQEAIRHH